MIQRIRKKSWQTAKVNEELRILQRKQNKTKQNIFILTIPKEEILKIKVENIQGYNKIIVTRASEKSKYMYKNTSPSIK